MKTFSGKEVCRIIERYSFKLIRQRGSHVIMQKKTENSTTTVPVSAHKELKAGTLRSIIRQSGVPKHEFD